MGVFYKSRDANISNQIRPWCNALIETSPSKLEQNDVNKRDAHLQVMQAREGFFEGGAASDFD
jgi:hypothetical protein